MADKLSWYDIFNINETSEEATYLLRCRNIFELALKNEFLNLPFIKVLQNKKVGQVILTYAIENNYLRAKQSLIIKFMDHNGDMIETTLIKAENIGPCNRNRLAMIINMCPEELINRAVDEAIEWSLEKDPKIGFYSQKVFMNSIKFSLNMITIEESINAIEQIMKDIIEDDRFHDESEDVKKTLLYDIKCTLCDLIKESKKNQYH